MLRLGTRGSALALAQARAVAADLSEIAEVELAVIDSSSAPVTDKSRWTKAIDKALLDGEIDLALHSAKDVPVERPEGIVAVAITVREDPADALIGAESLESLPSGARVGTSSPRRAALVGALREDLNVVELRGNVDTRLRRVEDGDVDCAILASAGLNRLGVDVTAIALDPSHFTPAAGQGTLMLEARRDDAVARDSARHINDPDAELELAAERAVIRELGADCHTAVGALARTSGERLLLEAVCLTPDGSAWLRDRIEGDAKDADALGVRLARRMISAGAKEILAAGRGEVA